MVAVTSLVLGACATAASVYLCVRSVDGRQIDLQKPDLVIDGPDGVGPLPEVARLHVRRGVYWLVASDRLPGVWWLHLERVGAPSINPDLTIELVPDWAEPPLAWQRMKAVATGGSQDGDERHSGAVGTLAVGWPWLAIAQQWVEHDSTVGFIPHLDNDDDGSTTARAASRFGSREGTTRILLLWGGLAGDIGLFAAVVAPIVWLARRRWARRHAE